MKKQEKVPENKVNVVFLKGKKLVLRPVSEKDIPLFVRWINDPEIRIFIKRVFPLTEGEEKDWYENIRKKSDKNVTLVIEVKGKAIGVIGLHDISWRDGVATTGAFIGEKSYWNQGYGTDAKMTLLNYAFNTLNLRKIMSHVKAFNKRSLAYSLHCGYCIEARLRRQLFTDGQYCDLYILGLFKSRWLHFWKAYNGK